MTSLSLVIPVLNERENLKQLANHLRQEAAFAEIIVVDGGSTDGSQKIAETFASQVFQSDTGRAVQMNIGAEKSTKEYILFLHADTRLPPGFANKFKKWAEQKPVWGFSPVKLDGNHWLFRLIERAISIRSRLTYGASGDQAICVERKHFLAIGGYENISLMEDLSICRRLSKRYKPCLFNSPVITSSRRWEQQGIIKTVLLMWRLRFYYYLGTSPEKLAARYR